MMLTEHAQSAKKYLNRHKNTLIDLSRIPVCIKFRGNQYFLKSLHLLILVCFFIFVNTRLARSQDSALPILNPPINGTAQYPYDTLLDAVYTQNTELKTARESYIQGIIDVKDAKAGFQPIIDFGLSASYLHNYPLANVNISFQELFADSPMAGLFPPGDMAIMEFDNNNFGLSLSLQQPIFLWGKVFKSVDLYSTVSDINNIQLYDLQQKLSTELKTRLAAVYFLENILTELSLQKDQAQKLINRAEQGQKEGLLLQQNVLEASINAREIDLITAQITNEILNNVFRLQTMTGIATLQADSVVYDVEAAQEDYDAAQMLLAEDRIKLIAKALNPDRSAIQSVNLAYTVAKIADSISSASMYWKPDIALQASLDYGDSIQGFQDDGFGGVDKLSATVSIGIQTSLWDGGAKLNDRKRTESEMRAAEATIEQVKLDITQVLNEQLTAMSLALAQIDFLEAKIAVRKMRIEQETQLFEGGSGSEIDILESTIELGTVEIQKLQQHMIILSTFYTLQYLLGE